MIFQPVIKWSGSKRSQATTIVSYFPDEIDTYYEPFVGGGSVLFSLLHSNKQVNNYICSDINPDLISLWIEIKNSPLKLIQHYTHLWNELNKDDNQNRRNEFYMSIRKRFNAYKNPADFLFLNRTCTNGLIRYNQKGEFNSSFHFSRKGIIPSSLEEIILNWSFLLNQHNVEFKCEDYQSIISKEGDVIYCDPPYVATKGMYYGAIDYNVFFQWIRSQKGNVFFSFDGKRGEKDFTYHVPEDIYKQHIYIPSGVSSFTRLKMKEITNVYESLYIC